MIPSIQSRALRACVSLPFHIRSLATHATTLPSTTSAPAAASSPNLPSVPQPSTPNNAEEGPLRPHLNIPVDPNHGLWAFFRRKVDKGVVSYDTVEAPHPGKDFTGQLSVHSHALASKLINACLLDFRPVVDGGGAA